MRGRSITGTRDGNGYVVSCIPPCSASHTLTLTQILAQASLRYCRLKIWDGYLKACQPAGWSDRYKRPISHMTDGSCVGANTPRKSSPLGRLMTNSKIHKCAALGITLSTPTGCGFLCMPLYTGRLSEVAYMSIHQRWFDMIPPGFARLVDKGFARTTRFYRNYNLAYVPAFVRSDTKDLSGAALKDASKQSSDRYTCEVYFARFASVYVDSMCTCLYRTHNHTQSHTQPQSHIHTHTQ